MISTWTITSSACTRAMHRMLPGGLFNYFHRSVSYLASRIQPDYRGSRRTRRGGGGGGTTARITGNHTHGWMQEEQERRPRCATCAAYLGRDFWASRFADYGARPVYGSLATRSRTRRPERCVLFFFAMYNAAINASAPSARNSNCDKDNRPGLARWLHLGALSVDFLILHL